MYGDLGDDTLSGGTGADTFHLSRGGGHDRVLDFNAGEGDRIQLDPGAAFGLTAAGADTVITLSDTGDDIVLAGVAPSNLPPGSIFLA